MDEGRREQMKETFSVDQLYWAEGNFVKKKLGRSISLTTQSNWPKQLSPREFWRLLLSVSQNNNPGDPNSLAGAFAGKGLIVPTPEEFESFFVEEFLPGINGGISTTSVPVAAHEVEEKPAQPEVNYEVKEVEGTLLQKPLEDLIRFAPESVREKIAELARTLPEKWKRAAELPTTSQGGTYIHEIEERGKNKDLLRSIFVAFVDQIDHACSRTDVSAQFEATIAQLLAVLDLTEISAKYGGDFNYPKHELVSRDFSDEVLSGKILRIMSRGFMISEDKEKSMLRPARVILSKGSRFKS